MGSARNKLILIPAALLLTKIASWMITPFLLLGGCYLCYEGFEKVASIFLNPTQRIVEKNKIISAVHNPEIDLVTFEQEKVKAPLEQTFIICRDYRDGSGHCERCRFDNLGVNHHHDRDINDHQRLRISSGDCKAR